MLSFISDKNTPPARPEDLARRRAMAQAMIRSGTERTPQDPWEGLAAVARALSGNYADYKLGKEEAAGWASGSAAYQPIADALKAGKPVDNTALVGAMSNDWLSDSERNVLRAYFKQPMRR